MPASLSRSVAFFTAQVAILALASAARPVAADPEPAAADTFEALAARAYTSALSRAIAAEYGDKWEDAATAREEALAMIDERLALCERLLARIDEVAVEGNDEQTCVAHWRQLIEDVQYLTTRDRTDCQRWLDECKKDKGGALPNLMGSRRIVWEREAEIFDERADCEKSESKGKFENAHPYRRRVAIVANANARFYPEKIEGLERNLKIVERNRHTKETDAGDRIREQIAYFEAVVADANSLAEFYERWRDDTSDEAWNQGHATFWQLLPAMAERFGLATLSTEMLERVAQERAMCEGRAAYYTKRNGDDDGE